MNLIKLSRVTLGSVCKLRSIRHREVHGKGSISRTTFQKKAGNISRAHYSTNVVSILTLPFKKIYFFFKNDPFARVSVVFGGGVLCLLMIVEALTPKQRKDKAAIVHLPPKSGHTTVQRDGKIAQLVGRLPSWFSTGPSLVCITGPWGSGKTELAYQFAQKFTKMGGRRFQKGNKQVLLYMDASDPVSLDYSLRWAARSVGVSQDDVHSKSEVPRNGSDGSMDSNERQLFCGFRAVFDSLAAKKTKWLLVIDSINSSTVEMVDTVLKDASGRRNLRKGCIVAVSKNGLPSCPKVGVVHLNQGLSPDESCHLLKSLSGISATDSNPLIDQQISQLADSLRHVPMAVALAALTIKLYSYFISSSNASVRDSPPVAQALQNYCELVVEAVEQDSPTSPKDITLSSLQRYIEAATAIDWHLTHAIDFLSLCNGCYPIPISVLQQHLRHPFYRLPDVAYNSPLVHKGTDAVATPPSTEQNASSLQSYFTLLKKNLPFIGGKFSSAREELQESLSPSTANASLPGPLTSLKASPFCRTYSLQGTSLELAYINPLLFELTPKHFLCSTLPRLEQAHLTGAEEDFQRNTWFKRFRSFSPNQAISKYRSTLPGLSGGGVATEEQFKADQMNVSLDTTNIHLKHSHYLHSISHHHRVVSSLHKELKHLSRDAEDVLTRRFLLPHLAMVSGLNILSRSDQQLCEILQLATTATLSPNKSDQMYTKCQAILSDQVDMWGPSSPELVFTLAVMAELAYYSEDFTSSKRLLQQCLDLHEQVPKYKRSPEQLIDMAAAVLSLGLAQAALGEKEDSKDSLEKALVLFQTVPAEREVPRKHRKLIASTVTDLGHAFLLLGDLSNAKRYLDLSVMAHRNIYPDGHAELARTLNVMSIAQALQGNISESKSLRNEVGKMEAELAVHNTML